MTRLPKRTFAKASKKRWDKSTAYSTDKLGNLTNLAIREHTRVKARKLGFLGKSVWISHDFDKPLRVQLTDSDIERLW
jgi:hypothetical protein